jgi:hypothetical protein
MLEEIEIQPTSQQHTPLGKTPRTPSSPAFVPIDDFIPEDFRDFFSDSEYASLYPSTTDFNYRTPTYSSPIEGQRERKAVLSYYQHDVYNLRKQVRSPYKHLWSNAARESYLAQTEDELFDVVMSEFLECLGHQFDNAAHKFMKQYDHTAVEDDIAVFESEFLDLLVEVDIRLRKVTKQPTVRRVVPHIEELWKVFWETYEPQLFVSKDQLPWQLGLLEYAVCVVGLREISSPKQQQRDTTRCCKG